jgi:hypothetical protein
MDNHEWWVRILKGAVWIVAMTIVMGWIARSRTKDRKNKNPNTLTPPRSLLIIGLICFLLFGGVAVFSNVYSNGTETWWTTAGFAGVALAGLAIVIDYVIARHQVSDSGLWYGRWFGSRRSLQWSELRTVRYAPLTKWFRLETTNGEVARISAYLTGLPEFARLVLKHAPSDSIEEETLSILQATAHGNPPPVW